LFDPWVTNSSTCRCDKILRLIEGARDSDTLQDVGPGEPPKEE
jgi:hypothetical protein